MVKKDRVAAAPAPEPTGGATLDLSSRALCMDADFALWDPKVTDGKVSREVAERAGITLKAGKYTKQLFPFDKPEYDALYDKIWEGVKYYHAHTVPWEFGVRLLKSTFYQECSTRMKFFSEEVVVLVKAFVKVYPSYILKAEEPQHLGPLFKMEDYPKVADVKNKFGIIAKYSPVASPGDFRLELDKALLDELKSQHAVEFVSKQSEMTKKVWKKIHDAVMRAAKLAKKDSKVFDTIFTDLDELVDTLPALNLLDDPDMIRMEAELRAQLANKSADIIRNDPSAKLDVAMKAQALADKMSKFM